MSAVFDELLAAVEKCRATTIEIEGVTWPYSPGELILYVHPDDLAMLRMTSYYRAESPNIEATLIGVPFRESTSVPHGKVIAAPTPEAIGRKMDTARALLARHGIGVPS